MPNHSTAAKPVDMHPDVAARVDMHPDVAARVDKLEASSTQLSTDIRGLYEAVQEHRKQTDTSIDRLTANVEKISEHFTQALALQTGELKSELRNVQGSREVDARDRRGQLPMLAGILLTAMTLAGSGLTAYVLLHVNVRVEPLLAAQAAEREARLVQGAEAKAVHDLLAAHDYESHADIAVLKARMDWLEKKNEGK